MNIKKIVNTVALGLWVLTILLALLGGLVALFNNFVVVNLALCCAVLAYALERIAALQGGDQSELMGLMQKLQEVANKPAPTRSESATSKTEGDPDRGPERAPEGDMGEVEEAKPRSETEVRRSSLPESDGGPCEIE